MRIAILQSNYLPWKGYFDIINSVDLFIFYDDVQYTKNDWRNRNKVKAAGGVNWLTIPCGSDENRLICDVAIKDARWQRDHWKTLQQNYSRTRYFSTYAPFFEDFYLGHTWNNLSELNQYLIRHISAEFLGSRTRFADSRAYGLTQRKGERVVELCRKVGAMAYLSGPAAKEYLSQEDFGDSGIKLEWMDYSGYPEYQQLYPPFVHGVSIVDLLFNEGPDAPRYMKSFGMATTAEQN